MTHRTEITIEPGTSFSIEGLWSAYLLRINQKSYSRFELVFDDYETAMLLEVDTHGINRTRLEGAHRNIDSLTIEAMNTITVPGLDERTIFGFDEIREGRFRFRLEKKYVAAVNVDVVTPVDRERTNRLRAEYEESLGKESDQADRERTA